MNKPHENVTIELNKDVNFSILSQLLKESGNTKIKLRIDNSSKIYTFELKNPRKFDIKTYNTIKDKEFIKKISF